MDKLEKTDKMMFDKVMFELEQENKKLVNRTALEKWISDGCPFEEDEDARECEARENGVGVTHSGSTVFVKEPAEITLSFVEDMMMEAKFTRQIGPLLCPGRQARLSLPQTEPRPPNFVNTINIVVKVKSGNISGPGKVSERNDKRFGTTKSVESNHWMKQECHH
ncbi:hypothetical protein C1645_731037 [Glomus cerebriforme]|uniref:Uncharacterized protein n=1 Tax=Glomus cerebriforme TaxID=658196 RepID=A0A397TRJ0_9GLOM|nr:hypothetical protein C1645_731037 [Glomus cerebriforme]